MDDKSTTPADNPTNDDALAEGTTVTDPKAGTDNQPAEKNEGDNTDNTSKSTDDTKSADDGKESTDTSDDKEDTPASKLDDDLDDWIIKRGMKVPETDEEKQSFQDLRDDQRNYTREQQAKKDADELSRAVNEAKPEDKPDDDEEDALDPLEIRQNKIEADLAEEKKTRLQSEFYTSNQITPEQSQAILDVMKEKFAAPTTDEGKKRAFGLWSDPEMLPDLLDLAKARLSKATSSTVADEAKREERERIARESNAKSPGRSATDSPTSNKTEDDARLERFKARYNKT